MAKRRTAKESGQSTSWQWSGGDGMSLERDTNSGMKNNDSLIVMLWLIDDQSKRD